MTPEEARLFFPYSEGDDWQELYEERLFEYKQFFLTRPVVSRVFQARLDKLRKMDAAYQALTGEQAAALEMEEPLIPAFPEVVLEAYRLYEQEKAKARQKLALSQTSRDLQGYVAFLMHLTSAYQRMWYNESVIDESVNVSKEPDTMELLRAIRLFNEAGGQTFADIPRINSATELLNEMKRVSLLLKKFG